MMINFQIPQCWKSFDKGSKIAQLTQTLTQSAVNPLLNKMAHFSNNQVHDLTSFQLQRQTAEQASAAKHFPNKSKITKVQDIPVTVSSKFKHFELKKKSMSWVVVFFGPKAGHTSFTSQLILLWWLVLCNLPGKHTCHLSSSASFPLIPPPQWNMQLFFYFNHLTCWNELQQVLNRPKGRLSSSLVRPSPHQGTKWNLVDWELKYDSMDVWWLIYDAVRRFSLKLLCKCQRDKRIFVSLGGCRSTFLLRVRLHWTHRLRRVPLKTRECRHTVAFQTHVLVKWMKSVSGPDGVKRE